MTRRQLQHLIRRFERDRHSGAAELARDAVQILAEANQNRAALNRLRRRLAAAHPTMASVWNAVHAATPERFLERQEAGWRHAVRRARRLLRGKRTVVTISYSSTLAATLERRPGVVVVGQSLPGDEGKRMAAVLRRRGTRATVVPDATLGAWVAEADAVVFGADAVTPRGVINKIGSRLLALAAKASGCPCYVVADATKVARPSSPFPLPRLGPDSLFEYVERKLVTVITG